MFNNQIRLKWHNVKRQKDLEVFRILDNTINFKDELRWGNRVNMKYMKILSMLSERR